MPGIGAGFGVVVQRVVFPGQFAPGVLVGAAVAPPDDLVAEVLPPENAVQNDPQVGVAVVIALDPEGTVFFISRRIAARRAAINPR